MRKLFPVTAALFGAILLAGCASNSQEITKMGGLSIKVENSTNAQRQYVGEIQRAIPITKHFKRANFDSNLGNLELAAGQLNLRYHEEAHQLEPMELKKNT